MRPVATGPPRAARRRARDAGTRPPLGESGLPTLLVVDDDPDFVAFVRAALRGEPLRIEAAGSGEEALLILDGARRPGEAAGGPAAILLDVVLPGMDGLTTFRALRRRAWAGPVILVTSHASLDTAVEAMRDGAYDFLTKPLRVGPLVQTIGRLLEERGRGAGPEDDGSAADRGAAREGRGERPESDFGMAGQSPQIVEVWKALGRVARTNATVLLVGESGTGKELAARCLHRHSLRRGPFVAVNCAGIPVTLLESELFGYEKGAFTGADRRKPGRFERAAAGTLFLDEVGDMPPALQGKILRALEEREIERLGGTRKTPVDIRLVAATNADLEELVRRGEFRRDLFYRLAVVTIRMPPLREREGDIRPLTEHFVRRLAGRIGRRIERIDPTVYERFEAYDWPGNVRELRNVLERSLILGGGPVLTPADLPELGRAGGGDGGGADALRALARDGVDLTELEKRYIAGMLVETEGNRAEAARRLGIHRNTLRRKIRQYGLQAPG